MDSFKKMWVWVLGILLVIGFGSAVYFYQKYEALSANPNAETQAQVQSLVDQVGKLMVLPANETPTVATVADASKVSDQPFFANAQNGDKLLAYTKAMQAILYRPSINKIISVGPIVINSNTQAGQNTPTTNSTTKK